MLLPNKESPSELETAAEDIPLAEALDVQRPAIRTGALVASGTFWLLLQTLGSKAVLLLSQLVLAWLLDRKDFGKIGMAYTVTAFIALLINPGIDVILIRRRKRFDLWSAPAFYFCLATGLLGCVVILAAAPVAARLYHTPEIIGLLAVLALATPLGSLLLVPTAKLRAEMRFGILAYILFVQTIVQTLFTLGFAAAGFGVYAFVLPMPFVYLTSAVILWSIAKPNIGGRSPLRHWRYLIGDSSFIFGSTLLMTVVSQGDNMILGMMYDDSVVGPYFFAYGIALQAIRLTAGSLQSVLLAGLSRMPTFSPQQTQAALRATKAIALIGMPLCMLQAVVAGPLLRALYDEKWVAAIPLIQWISVGMAFDIASWPASGLMQSRGQFRWLFIWSSSMTPIFLLTVFIGAYFAAALGVAVAVCFFYATLSPIFAFLVFRLSNVDRSEIVGLYLRPILIGLLVAATSTSALRLSDAAGFSLLVQSALGLGAGLVTMGVSARVIMSSAWHDIVDKVKHVLIPFLPASS